MFFHSVKDHRINSFKIEFNLTRHCNSTCNECSHFAPYLQPELASFETFAKDLEALAGVYRVRRFRFCGGEPLLHPDISSFIRQVRESGITDAIEIVTNGALVHRLTDEVLRDIDMLSVTCYSESLFDSAKHEFCIRKCREHKTILNVMYCDQFRVSQLADPNEDDLLTHRIYKSCQIVNTWYAQTFYDGRFYLCSRPLYLAEYLQRSGRASDDFQAIDGVALHDDNLFRHLLDYLHRDTHLASCRYCFGTVGKRIPWRQLTRDERLSTSPPERNPGDMIDHELMNSLLKWNGTKEKLFKVVPSYRISHLLDRREEFCLRTLYGYSKHPIEDEAR